MYVNGFYCRDCADVSLAKRGEDPARAAKSKLDPDGKNREPTAQAPGQTSARTDFSGLGVNAADGSGAVGSLLHLKA